MSLQNAISIPLYPGEVELENVPLRRDALRFASEGSGGPDAYLSSVDVKCGLIGRIKLKIPVSRYYQQYFFHLSILPKNRGLIALIVDCRLRSEPWSIVLEKVYIVVGPQSFKDYDPFKEEQLELEVKLSALDGIESEWRALNENGGGGNGGASRSGH